MKRIPAFLAVAIFAAACSGPKSESPGGSTPSPAPPVATSSATTSSTPAPPPPVETTATVTTTNGTVTSRPPVIPVATSTPVIVTHQPPPPVVEMPPPPPPPCTGTPVPTGKVNQIGQKTCTFCDGHVDVCPTLKPPPPPPPSVDPSTFEDCAKYGSDVHSKWSIDTDKTSKSYGQYVYYGIQNLWAWEDATPGKYSTVAESFSLEYFPRGYFMSYAVDKIAANFGKLAPATPKCYFGGQDFTGIKPHLGGKAVAYHHHVQIYGVAGSPTHWADAFLAQHPETVKSANNFILRVMGLHDVRGYPFKAKPFAAAGNNCTAYPCH